jgi:hypothetical protein
MKISSVVLELLHAYRYRWTNGTVLIGKFLIAYQKIQGPIDATGDKDHGMHIR